MRELDEMLELRDMITKAEEKLETIIEKAMSPKTSTMSSFGGASNHAASTLEDYVARREECELKIKRLIAELEEKWNALDNKMIDLFIDESHRQLMYFRFFQGFSWKRCTEEMRKIEGNHWNENRAFRYYRKVVSMLQKSRLNFV